jgi:hypothetical protein
MPYSGQDMFGNFFFFHNLVNQTTDQDQNLWRESFKHKFDKDEKGNTQRF